MDLCGHATLATAFVVMNFVDPELTKIFETQSGNCRWRGRFIYNDFPSRMPLETAAIFCWKMLLAVKSWELIFQEIFWCWLKAKSS